MDWGATDAWLLPDLISAEAAPFIIDALTDAVSTLLYSIRVVSFSISFSLLASGAKGFISSTFFSKVEKSAKGFFLANWFSSLAATGALSLTVLF